MIIITFFAGTDTTFDVASNNIWKPIYKINLNLKGRFFTMRKMTSSNAK